MRTLKFQKAKAGGEYVRLVVAKRLTDENWKRLEKKRIYIFVDGGLLLKVSRKIAPMLDEGVIEVLCAVLNEENGEAQRDR